MLNTRKMFGPFRRRIMVTVIKKNKIDDAYFHGHNEMRCMVTREFVLIDGEHRHFHEKSIHAKKKF